MDLGEDRDPKFRYVLVVVELYTRFVWLYPIPSKHALLVARHVSAVLVCSWAACKCALPRAVGVRCGHTAVGAHYDDGT